MWHGGTVFLHIFTFCVSVCGGNCEPKVFSFGVVCPTQGWMAKFVCMSFKGDWKYLKQIFNLKRNMNAPKLCFACMAEKTGDEYDQHLARCTLARNNLELPSSLESSSCTILPGFFPRAENILRYATCLAFGDRQRFDSRLQQHVL